MVHLSNTGPLEDGLHRAKDLILGDAHVISHVTEDCRLQVVPFVPCHPQTTLSEESTGPGFRNSRTFEGRKRKGLSLSLHCFPDSHAQFGSLPCSALEQRQCLQHKVEINVQQCRVA